MTGLSTEQAQDRYIRGYGNTQIDNAQKSTKRSEERRV